VRPNKGFATQLLQYELKLRGTCSMRRSGSRLVPLDAPLHRELGKSAKSAKIGLIARTSATPPREAPALLPGGTPVRVRAELSGARAQHAGKLGAVAGASCGGGSRGGAASPAADLVVQLAAENVKVSHATPRCPRSVTALRRALVSGWVRPRLRTRSCRIHIALLLQATFAHAELLQRVAVTLTALESRSELNGRVGTVEGWDGRIGQYEVRVAAVRVYVRPRNVILPAGCRATLTGLVEVPVHNGVVGRVASHDDENGRYHIEIEARGGSGGGGASTAHWLSVLRANAVL